MISHMSFYNSLTQRRTKPSYFNRLDPYSLTYTQSCRASVDKLKAHVPFFHYDPVTGGLYEVRPGIKKHSLFWVALKNGKVGARSDGHRWIMVTFNPSQIAYGHNMFCYDEPLYSAIVDVTSELDDKCLKLQLSRDNSVRIRSGVAKLSELSLCGDWIFPTRAKLDTAFRSLQGRWNWRANRRRNINWSTTIYLNQTSWDLRIYVKHDQVANQHPNWPDDIQALAQNRLRLEVTLKRQELRHLGTKVAQFTGRYPELDLSIVSYWEPGLYDAVLGLYLSRLRPAGNPRPAIGVVPLYCMFAQHDGQPAWHRQGE